MDKIKQIILISSLFFFTNHVNGQEIPVHHSNERIYEFLDEMSALQLIEINAVVKPFSRFFIAGLLKEIYAQKPVLNQRQTEELNFFLKEFSKEINLYAYNDNLIKRIAHIRQKQSQRADLYYYRDSLFNLTINPIGGFRFYSNKNGGVMHQWTGLEANAYIGNKWGFYVNFRDNRMGKMLIGKEYLTTFQGRDNKSNATDFSDIRGGVSYSWNWGSVTFLKDHFIWGNNYHGSIIFSGRIPSISHLKLRINAVKWFEFNYLHGWIVSEVIDSNSIYDFGGGAVRQSYYPKFIAANIYTIKPTKYLYLSAGNSMVYSSYRAQMAYLIPFLFFKPVEHTIAASNENNAQIFFDISTRNIKYVHLYGSFYVDEVNFSNFFDTSRHSNWFAYKAGMKISDYPLKNLFFTFEWTKTNPMVYKHYFPTSTFESNQYCLGHYLRDNAHEYYFKLTYKPIAKLNINFDYTFAEKGPDYPDKRNDPNYYPGGKKFMKTVEWSNKTWRIFAGYELFHDALFYVEFARSNITAANQTILHKYTPGYFQGENATFVIGTNFSF